MPDRVFSFASLLQKSENMVASPGGGGCVYLREYPPAPPPDTTQHTHMNQFTIADRKRIEFLLSVKTPVLRIAGDLGRPKSTVLREIIGRAVVCERHYGCSNRLCANFDTCSLRVFSAAGDRSLRKNAPKCFDGCPDFAEAVCGRLAVASHVCNGCERFRACPLSKRLYVADSAQADRESLLHDSRMGVQPSDRRLSEMNAVLSPCLLKGQSIRNVIANNAAVFSGVAERTVYDYVNGGLFDAKRFDLPEACRRRPRRRKKQTKTKAKCRVGRDYKTFLEFCRVNEVREWTELDTVIGIVGGKVLFTMILPGGLMIAFLRDRKTSNTCTRLFNMLWEAAGPELFVKLFFVILTDNGMEFADAEMIENFRPDPRHNPKRLLPRGVHLFYCDAYCSCQKPHVEREHREARRILEHGVSFNGLDQDKINAVLSNVASYTRGTLGNKTPYDCFVEKFGDAGRRFLEKIGIVRVPPNDVVLHPFLLGEVFNRQAQAVVLKRNGVKPQLPATK